MHVIRMHRKNSFKLSFDIKNTSNYHGVNTPQKPCYTLQPLGAFGQTHTFGSNDGTGKFVKKSAKKKFYLVRQSKI